MGGSAWVRFGEARVYNGSDETPRIVAAVPPGLYELDRSMSGFYAKQVDLLDEGYRPSRHSAALLGEVDAFLDARERYRAIGAPYKRGFLLHGPPGCGKTSLARAAIRRFVDRGHVAFQSHPLAIDSFRPLFRQFRGIEPDRPALLVVEDVDELVDGSDETNLLAMLDGVEASCDGLFVLATTNSLGDLPDRIRRRPSRFDRVEEVSPPGQEDRDGYITGIPCLDPGVAEAVSEATEGLPYAAIKEVVIAAVVFGEPVESAAARVRALVEPAADPEPVDA